MKAKTLMIQGTGSHVGKSIITAALCRIFRQDGYRVAPFKSQNMSLNSFVTEEGEEMGRAQVVQAEACGIKPHVSMNPILLKPTTDVGTQVIVMGRPVGNMTVGEYICFKPEAMKIATIALRSLMEEYDIVVIEGAGSPAEINLKSHDIVNMGIAEIADAPVLLVGDIDRGGVFAWFIGTMELLEVGERERVKGFIINKFRGEKDLLKSGLSYLMERAGKPTIGVIPYFSDIHVMEEDSVNLGLQIEDEGFLKSKIQNTLSKINIDVIHLPHISNFTDFNPLEIEPDVHLRYVRRPQEINSPDILIIPGSKNTISDLLYLKTSGMAEKIRHCAENRSILIGICGGYQMLGRRIYDREGVESDKTEAEGLNLLNMVTEFREKKTTCQVRAIHLDTGFEIDGYEIHMGESKVSGNQKHLFKIISRSGVPVDTYDGLRNEKFDVWGTYLHGIFEDDRFRRWFLNSIRLKNGLYPITMTVPYDKEKEYNRLADLVRENLDMEALYKILGI